MMRRARGRSDLPLDVASVASGYCVRNVDLLHGPQGIKPDAAVARRHRRKQSLPALVVAVRSTDTENGAFAVVVGSFPSGTQRRS